MEILWRSVIYVMLKLSLLRPYLYLIEWLLDKYDEVDLGE